MYLTPHRHALGTTMNKRQESRKKTNQKEGDPLSYTEQYIQTERERTGHSLCAALKWGGGQGGWAVTGLSHMLTTDTGKSKRTRRTPRKHPTARDTGDLRLGFPQKRPNASEKAALGRGRASASWVPLLVETQGDSWSCWLGGEGTGILWGRGPEFLPLPMGMALCCQKSKLLASRRALATPVGPRRQCLAAFKANQFHDETQGRNGTTAENTLT